jgi:hypothetical protein
VIKKNLLNPKLNFKFFYNNVIQIYIYNSSYVLDSKASFTKSDVQKMMNCMVHEKNVMISFIHLKDFRSSIL